MAKKEHDEFASNIDLIDVLPPGLYEAVLVPKDQRERGADLVAGDYLVRFEARTLHDIRALGGNDEADELEFAAAARIGAALGSRRHDDLIHRRRPRHGFRASTSGFIGLSCSPGCARAPARTPRNGYAGCIH